MFEENYGAEGGHQRHDERFESDRNRRGSTISARAPAGKVQRNIGKLLATCTRETALGSGLRVVISHADEVSEIARPVSEKVVATHMTTKGALENAPFSKLAGPTYRTSMAAPIRRRHEPQF